MKVRKTNTRSLKAVLKLPYVGMANTTYPKVYNKINEHNDVYDLFVITKEHYSSYQQFATNTSMSTEEEVG